MKQGNYSYDGLIEYMNSIGIETFTVLNMQSDPVSIYGKEFEIIDYNMRKIYRIIVVKENVSYNVICELYTMQWSKYKTITNIDRSQLEFFFSKWFLVREKTF